MGNEDRGSGSGSSTLMIVLAILAGILILGCCGGLVVIGLGSSFILSRSQPVPAQIRPPVVASPQIQESPEIKEALEKMDAEMQPLKLPEPVESPQPPSGNEPSAVPEPKDE